MKLTRATYVIKSEELHSKISIIKLCSSKEPNTAFNNMESNLQLKVVKSVTYTGQFGMLPKRK
jgi:hypothetical protein